MAANMGMGLFIHSLFRPFARLSHFYGLCTFPNKPVEVLIPKLVDSLIMVLPNSD